MRFAIFIILINSLLWAKPLWDLKWTGEPGYEWDGVEPDYFDADSRFVFRIAVESPGEPSWVVVNLDRNADGDFSKLEQMPMMLEKKDNTGYIYRAETTLNKPDNSRPLAYYFSAQIGNAVRTSPLLLGPFMGNKVSFILIGDTIWHITEPVVPLEIVINSGRNKFLLVNTGEVPITFGLSIDPASESVWEAVENYGKIGENRYVLSAVFSQNDRNAAQPTWFNANDWDDVVTAIPRFASGERFAIDKQSSGAKVEPLDTVSLWFNFISPASSNGLNAEDWQTIKIRIFAIAE